jgi:hypothetical protein
MKFSNIEDIITYIVFNNHNIKITKYDNKYPIDNIINFELSNLYFFEYKNKKIFIIDFIFNSSELYIYLIDYKKIFYKQEFYNDEFELDIEKFNQFIFMIINFSIIIIQQNIILNKNYYIYNISPTLNKVYLKNIFKKKYCVIFLEFDKCKINFNDDKENWIEVSDFEQLNSLKKLDIFRKKFLFNF